MNMRVELFGLPGAGKSSISNILNNEVLLNLTAKSVESPEGTRPKRRVMGPIVERSWRKKEASVVRKFWDENREFHRFLEAKIFSLEPPAAEKFLRDLNATVLRDRAFDLRYRKGILKIESEGFVQRLLSLCVRMPDSSRQEVASEYLEFLALADVYVMVHVEMEVAVQRVSKRHQENPNRKISFDQCAWGQALSIVTSVMECRGIRPIVLEGSAPLEENKTKLLGFLKTKVQNPGIEKTPN